MLTMAQINHIKDLSNCGYRISEISRKTGIDPKTIRKYLSMEDFSPVPPVMKKNPSKLLSGKLNDAPSGRLFRADFRTLQMCQSL